MGGNVGRGWVGGLGRVCAGRCGVDDGGFAVDR